MHCRWNPRVLRISIVRGHGRRLVVRSHSRIIYIRQRSDGGGTHAGLRCSTAAVTSLIWRPLTAGTWTTRSQWHPFCSFSNFRSSEQHCCTWRLCGVVRLRTAARSAYRGGGADFKVGVQNKIRERSERQFFCTTHFSKCGGTSKQISVGDC